MNRGQATSRICLKTAATLAITGLMALALSTQFDDKAHAGCKKAEPAEKTSPQWTNHPPYF
jgi:hypothetical protein